MLAVGEQLNGIFYENSKTTSDNVLDGLSNTLLVGERSGVLQAGTVEQPNGENFFGSSWIGVVADSLYTGWRVVGWAGEPPNHPPGSALHFHGYAQFSSSHLGSTQFGFCDGSIHGIADEVASDVFLALGTIDGGEVVGEF